MKRSSSVRNYILALGAALASSAHAADVSSYGVAKAHVYVQSSAAAPVENTAPYLFTAWVDGNIDAITDATVMTPSGIPAQLSLNDSGSRYEFSFPGTLQLVNTIAGNGAYSFTIDSDNDLISLAQLSLSSSAFPTTIPQISNFDAAQNIDADAAFTLNWNTASDAPSYRLVILDGSDEVLVEEGSAASFTIPAGTLAADTSYTAKLRFRKLLSSDTTSIPGAMGTVELANETEFEIATAGDGGSDPGGDTTPPVLFLTSPVNGAVSVSASTSVSFTFNEAMQAAQSIQWSANINAGNVAYAWSNGGKTLTASYAGGFPTGSTITWTLNPAVFKDVAGNAMAALNLSGSFTTGTGGSVDPCEPGEDTGLGHGMLSKTVLYSQTGNSNPVQAAGLAAAFQGTYKGASNHAVTAVTISGPVSRTLQSVADLFFINEELSGAAALDAAFPSGNYTISATGAGSATVALGNVAQVPVPKINNLVELGSMNPASAFTLNFSAFTGATANDSIFISINEQGGTGSFHAPDICKNIELPVTATSVVIPANTFKAGAQYQGSITFSKGTGFNTNAIAETYVSANVSAQTEFGFNLGGGQTTAPRWTGTRRNPDGTITFTLSANAGASLIIEGSDLTAGWLQAGAGLATGGTFEFTVDPRLQPRRLFRAKVL